MDLPHGLPASAYVVAGLLVATVTARSPRRSALICPSRKVARSETSPSGSIL